MILTSLLCFFYEKHNEQKGALMDISIPVLDRTYKTDFDTAEMFIGYNDDDSEIVFIISRIKTSKHEFASRKYAQELERAEGNPKRYNAVIDMIVSESIFEGWKNLRDTNGQDIPATIPNKLAVLKKYPGISNKIIDFAAKNTNYQNPPEISADDEIVADKKSDEQEIQGN